MAQQCSHQEKLSKKQRYWKKHVESFRAGDLTQAQYCREHRLKAHCLVYWRKKIARNDQEQIPFVQLKLPDGFQVSSPSAIRIAVGNCRIEVERGFDPVTLKQLVHTLGQL